MRISSTSPIRSAPASSPVMPPSPSLPSPSCPRPSSVRSGPWPTAPTTASHSALLQHRSPPHRSRTARRARHRRPHQASRPASHHGGRQPPAHRTAPGPSPPLPGATNMPGVIEIKPEDRARYTRIFANSGPSGGLIDGDRAKEIFVKSKLPFDKLGAIWNLADTQARGASISPTLSSPCTSHPEHHERLPQTPSRRPPAWPLRAGQGLRRRRFARRTRLTSRCTEHWRSASGFGSAMGIQRQMTGSNFQASSAFQSPADNIPSCAAPTATAAAPAAAAPGT